METSNPEDKDVSHRTNLNDLPPEILAQIFEEVYQSCPPRDLKELSTLSRNIRSNLIPFIYRNGNLWLDGFETFCNKLREFQNENSLKFIRYIRIWGVQDSWRMRYWPKGYQNNKEFGPLIVPKPIPLSETISEALVSLVKKCQYIKDFEWAAEYHFPPSLLQALQEKHPTCKLHLRMFHVKRLADTGFITENDYNLLRSPLLYSISLKCPRGRVADDSGNTIGLNYNIERLLEAAPKNLKHVRVLPAGEPTEPEGEPEENLGDRQGSLALTSLMLLYGQNDLMLRDLKLWSKRIDFSKLVSLTLERVSDPRVFRYLKDKKAGSLDSLKMLDIDLCPTPELMIDAELMTQGVLSLFQSLGPLESICLSGFLEHTLLSAVLKQHGQKLRQLTLHPSTEAMGDVPVITQLQIQLIESLCPSLYRLEIGVNEEVIEPKKNVFTSVCPSLSSLRELTYFCRLGWWQNIPHMSEAIKNVFQLINKTKKGPPLAVLNVKTGTLQATIKGEKPFEILAPQEPFTERPNSRVSDYLFTGLPRAHFQYDS